MSDKPRHNAAAKAPISAHPAFPAIVGLWFAALLGIGSLVLPVALFEGLSTSIGLSSIVTAAQPPLGVTARILIAAGSAAAGMALGLALARRIVASQAPRPKSQRAAAFGKGPSFATSAGKRPILASEELGEDGIESGEGDANPAIGGRRRALAVHDESARSELLDLAPLPGIAPYAPAEPLDLAEFGRKEADHQEHEAEEARMTFGKAEPFGTSIMSARPTGTAYNAHARERQVEPEAAAAGDAPLDDAPVAFAKPEVPVVPSRAAEVPSTPVAAQDSIVDLVDRFARALERRREAPVEEAAPVVDLTFALGKTRAEAEPEAAPAPAQPIPVIPAALRPLGFDAFDEEDEDDAAPLPAFGLQFARPAAESPSTTRDDTAATDGAEEDATEGEYPSLLAMKSPFGLPREPVRIEDEDDDAEAPAIEPVVVFPGQGARGFTPANPAPQFGASALRPFDAPSIRSDGRHAASVAAPAAASGDTERALREALEKLQRMSGAA